MRQINRTTGEMMTTDFQTGWIPKSLIQPESGKALLGALFHGHPDILFVVDSHGHIVAANSIALKSLGYRRQQIEGQPIHMLVPKALRPQHSIRTQSFFNNPAHRPMGSGIDLDICDAAGNEYPVDITLAPFPVGTDQHVLVACRRLDADLADKQRQIHALAENARGYAVVLLDAEGKIRTWNDGAEQIFETSASAALGQDHSILFTQSDRHAGEPQRQLELARLSPNPVHSQGWRSNHAGENIWAECRCEASRNAVGQVTGFTRVMHDVTAHKLIEVELREVNQALSTLAADLERRVSERTQQLVETIAELRARQDETDAFAKTVANDLREKEVLLREVYHRVKNNLQVVQSLLKMRMRTLNSIEAKEALNAAVERVQVMATAHEHLYQMPDLANLSLSAYLKTVVDGAVESNSAHSTPPKIQFNAEDIPINLDLAIPLGLLVHELVSNCFKHAFNPNKPGPIRLGLISISITRSTEAVRLSIHDNGPGLPANFDAASTTSMGLKLAASLAKRLGGELRFSSSNGCTVEASLTRL